MMMSLELTHGVNTGGIVHIATHLSADPGQAYCLLSPDPPENCHNLNVKTLPKIFIFFKTIANVPISGQIIGHR